MLTTSIILSLTLSVFQDPTPLETTSFEVALAEFNTVIDPLGFAPLRQIIYWDEKSRIISFDVVEEFPQVHTNNRFMQRTYGLGLQRWIKAAKIIRTRTEYDPEQQEQGLNPDWKRPGLHPKRPPREVTLQKAS